MFLCKVKRLIVLGMILTVAGCTSQMEIVVPKGKEAGNAFDRAVAIFRQAEDMGAQEAAPKSYQKAQKAMDKAMAIIKQEPENKQGIDNMVNQFGFEAEHLLHIISEVNELRSVESIAIENVVLSAEYRLLAISDALKQPDPRRQKLYDQSVAIAEAAKRVVISSNPKPDAKTGMKQHISKNELDKAQTRIQQLELQLKNSQDINGQLKGDNKSSQKRIEFLERLVLELTEKNTRQEETIKQLKGQLNKPKPPVE